MYTQPRQREDLRPDSYRIDVTHRLSERESGELHDALAVETNPYQDYPTYLKEIKHIAASRIPGFFRDLCVAKRDRDIADEPVLYLKNCPIDREVPVLDFDAPLDSKYSLKKTFVGEALLSVAAEFLGTHVVGYRTANRGDKFQDVHPMRALQDTPSQKTAGTLKFHADIPNNRVRPDWVYLLSLRNPARNEIYTAFTRLKDVYEYLGPQIVDVLKQPVFYSPRDTIHVHGGQTPGYSPLRPLIETIGGKTYLTYFQGNTTSFTRAGQAALTSLAKALQELRYNLFLAEGDFVSFSNNTCVHARDVVKLVDVEANRTRWLLKTWNVDDLEVHRPHLLPDRPFTSDE